MKIGITLRTMGPQSTRDLLGECAKLADTAGLDSLWVADHIAIPPDQAEGSGGRYLDPLTALAYLAGITNHIGLGTGVLVLPYRAPLPTAKAIATVQELSGNRLLLGVGIGWMEAEFRATGADRRKRGRDSDAALKFFHRCFADDEVEANGQPFLFKPRPPRPPIYVGGQPPHALRRAVQLGDGWMPMVQNSEQLAAPIEELRRLAAEAGKPSPEVVAYYRLPLDDSSRARDEIDKLNGVGVTRVIHGVRYDDAAAYGREVDRLAVLVR